MKKLYILLSIAFIAVGCGSQRQAVSETVETSVYKRPDIVNAVKNGSFKLELIEEISNHKGILNAFDSFMEVNGNYLKFSVSPQIRKRSYLELLNREYDNAEIEYTVSRNSKKMSVSVISRGEESYRDICVNISIRTDSEICYVDIRIGHTGTPGYRFRARLIPLLNMTY